MKTIILYASKYGAAREIARRIAKKIEGAKLHDLKGGNIPPLDQYDCIIIGSSLYAGTIRKEAKSFLAQNSRILMEKQLGLFLSGLGGAPGEDTEKTYWAKNIPDELLKHAKAAMFLGGIFDPAKCGFLERLIIKAVAKTADYTDTIMDERITQLAGVLAK